MLGTPVSTAVSKLGLRGRCVGAGDSAAAGVGVDGVGIAVGIPMVGTVEAGGALVRSCARALARAVGIGDRSALLPIQFGPRAGRAGRPVLTEEDGKGGMARYKPDCRRSPT